MSEEEYRHGVAIIFFNAKRQIMLLERADLTGSFQTVQGGVDAGESEEAAAHREIYEEIGLNKVKLLAQSKNLLKYKIPEEILKKIKFNNPKFVGQKQRWFLAYMSPEIERNINFKVTAHPEFQSYKWVNSQYGFEEIVDFKREVFKTAIEEFLPLIKSYDI